MQSSHLFSDVLILYLKYFSNTYTPQTSAAHVTIFFSFITLGWILKIFSSRCFLVVHLLILGGLRYEALDFRTNA